MKDVQNERDERNIPIDRVGVKDVRYPVTVLDRANRVQHTIARFTLCVDLPHHFRGTHMSRFIELLNEHREEIHIDQLRELAGKMRARFESNAAHVSMRFPYFITKQAPVTGSPGQMDYECSFEVIDAADRVDCALGVRVPVMTLCPCSKEISERGAHNQRGFVELSVRYRDMVWIEELIELVESCASSPIYSVLKRPDEKFVTEHSYDHPRFVEDMVREAASKLNADERITWYRVAAENFESIHNHSAYAILEKNLTAPKA